MEGRRNKKRKKLREKKKWRERKKRREEEQMEGRGNEGRQKWMEKKKMEGKEKGDGGMKSSDGGRCSESESTGSWKFQELPLHLSVQNPEEPSTCWTTLGSIS